MLGLKFETATSWVDVASAGLEQVLTDHAFAEQKAASNAVSLIINYSEETELVQAMSDIAIEEMEHFKMVHEFMVKRGMTLGRDQSNDYARHLQGLLDPTVSVLLVTLDYDQSEMAGPPFSVSESEVRDLLGERFEVSRLSKLDVWAENPRFQQRGLTQMFEHVYQLKPHRS